MNVEYIDHMGNDLRVANAARVSFGKHHYEFTPKDCNLINYLAEHNHWTPFAHCFLTIRVKAPIFVARQLAKHQVGLVWNEVSRRYVDDEPEFYTPLELRKRAPEKKQGSSKETIGVHLEDHCKASLGLYKELLEAGVAPEEARMVLPLSTYTEWYWSGSLSAFARVVKLRSSDDVQEETREIASRIDSLCMSLWPVSWKALTNGS